jgi:Bacterial Ig-like domain (group 3)
VLFTEYHVMNLNGNGMSYPSECPGGKMSAQEEMLEYALFDLSAFVHPVVVPTVSIAFNPSPLVVKQNDTGDQVTISVTNSSTDTAIDPSAQLAITLPGSLVATAIVDSSQGWNCTLSTLKCTRATSIPSSVTDSITLTINVANYSDSSSTSAIKAVVSSPTFSNDVTALDTVIFQHAPKISWAPPAPIIYGTPLSEVQLDARAATPGKIVYTPAIGTVLPVGQQTLTAFFTPADKTAFTAETATVNLTVVPATPVISASPSPNPAFLSNAVTITAVVPSQAGMPSGTVTFFDGETQLGSAALTAGAATISTSALRVGSHNISAVYSGDANYHPATTITGPETIQDFAIAATPESSTGTPTLNPGASATYSFVVSPIGGATLPAALALSVTGMPPTAIVEFSPRVVPANAGTTKVTMVVHTPNLAVAEPAQSPLGKGALPVALGLLLLPFTRRIRRARRWIQVLGLSVAIGSLTVGMTACGGITYTTRTFSMTVKAQSGALAHTASVQLNVK